MQSNWACNGVCNSLYILWNRIIHQAHNMYADIIAEIEEQIVEAKTKLSESTAEEIPQRP